MKESNGSKGGAEIVKRTGAAQQDHNANKTSFVETYNLHSPSLYHDVLGRYAYNQYHDAFVEALDNRPRFRSATSIFEIGCLYGNSMQALTGGVKFARLETNFTRLNPNTLTIGADIAEQALAYGRKKGIFDETMVLDMNRGLVPELQRALKRCELVLCAMCLNYFDDGIFRDALDFHRKNGGKYAIYTTVPLFDERNYNPEHMLGSVKSYERLNMKHRDLTDLERKINSGLKESMASVYFVEY
mmetsp:Transcript_17075/g.41916  ORF Transcript_17075/g.41916 Transcript_17075/m.41916 type:complete len:244 (-) Transcript_17075:47-778(-)|eukprot:CAMPEP_0198332684 /NCGR_PEP_ID=MMETSP1450-20131203/18441_1 /TAXON_ID=753684 ORGANISM="Madagascaria erythrocladiodes, Strain CCMP3234" /NCGR_SAMPLE_ID=MMETSP1450 /ASSEMBLY_ACC=CAM_ASM_001115 /LENGTH=243 /DNA_ID=CAMNT_0044037151 /DNA_START=136 /DNA_END=867 /DNA_ORIENTATION=+